MKKIHRHILINVFGFRVALVDQTDSFVSQKEAGDKGSPGDFPKVTWEIYYRLWEQSVGTELREHIHVSHCQANVQATVCVYHGNTISKNMIFVLP